MNITKLLSLTGLLLLAGCSSSSSLNTVNEIQDMAVPVVHSQDTVSAESSEVTHCYKENATRLSKLQYSLKSTMLKDVKPSEIFDTHSDAHQVYTALSKLEQISAMNEAYRKEGNMAGLKAINEMLKPLNVAA